MTVKRLEATLWAGLALAALAFLGRPGLALFWARRIGGPAMGLLNRCTGRLPFPLAGPLAAFSIAAVLALRGAKGLRGWALALAAGAALLWLPGLAAPVEALPEPGADALEVLCAALVDALNASSLAFPTPAESLALAPEAAGAPGGAAKAALWPEWMRRLRVAGVAVPWTGEVIVDGGASPALIPFTAVHELTHIAGVADEGAANIAAWRRCMAAGGTFADSARLWALRYALGMLATADDAGCARAFARMDPELAALWPSLGGVLPPPQGARLCGSYHDLVRWLAAKAAVSSASASVRTS